MSLLTEEFSKRVSVDSPDVVAEAPDLLSTLFNKISPTPHMDESPAEPDLFVGQNPKDIAALQKTLNNTGIKVTPELNNNKVAKGVTENKSNVGQNITNAKEAKAGAIDMAQKMDKKNEADAKPQSSGSSPMRTLAASFLDPKSMALTAAATMLGGPSAGVAVNILTTSAQVANAAINPNGSGSQATFANPTSSTPKYGSKAEMKKMSTAGYGISESAPSSQTYGQQTFAKSASPKPALGKPDDLDTGRVQTTEDSLGGIEKFVMDSPQMAALDRDIEHYGDLQQKLNKREQDGVPLTRENANMLAEIGADQPLEKAIANNANNLTGVV